MNNVTACVRLRYLKLTISSVRTNEFTAKLSVLTPKSQESLVESPGSKLSEAMETFVIVGVAVIDSRESFGSYFVGEAVGGERNEGGGLKVNTGALVG